MFSGKSKSNLIIIHALLHAMAILLSSYLLHNTGHHQTVTYLIVALWFGSSTLYFGKETSLKCELAYIRNKVMRAPKR